MPGAVDALARLGALDRVPPERRVPFRGIRYLGEDGLAAQGRFASGTGLGIRRTTLSRALRGAAEAAGVRLEEGVEVRGARPTGRKVLVEASGGLECDFLVVADGLLSPLRRSLGLELPGAGPRRYGLRRHFEGVDPGEWVDVHWSAGAEAYLTPVGPDEIGVAFLWSDGAAEKPRFEDFLGRFPALAVRLRGGHPSSAVRGVGSMRRRARVALDRVALVGDAAGYLDALTGEGLGIAFRTATLLGEELPAWLDGDPAAPRRYAARHAALLRRHVVATEALLWLARRPLLRRAAIRGLAAFPRAFDAALAALQPNAGGR